MKRETNERRNSMKREAKGIAIALLTALIFFLFLITISGSSVVP